MKKGKLVNIIWTDGCPSSIIDEEYFKIENGVKTILSEEEFWELDDTNMYDTKIIRKEI